MTTLSKVTLLALPMIFAANSFACGPATRHASEAELVAHYNALARQAYQLREEYTRWREMIQNPQIVFVPHILGQQPFPIHQSRLAEAVVRIYIERHGRPRHGIDRRQVARMVGHICHFSNQYKRMVWEQHCSQLRIRLYEVECHMERIAAQLRQCNQHQSVSPAPYTTPGAGYTKPYTYHADDSYTGYTGRSEDHLEQNAAPSTSTYYDAPDTSYNPYAQTGPMRMGASTTADTSDDPGPTCIAAGRPSYN